MALATNYQIQQKDFVEYIEHTTRKKILSWRHSPGRFGREVYFTDSTAIFVEEGTYFDFSRIEYLEMPKSICISCGEEAHCGKFDRHGRCENKLTEFYKNVRKVYWHRYSKNKE